jgi:gluconokinase
MRTSKLRVASHYAPPLILSLDIGSSSTRAALFDSRGQLLTGSMAQEYSALRVSAAGTAEDDAEAVLARVARCIDAVLSRAGTLSEPIAAVAVATLASSLVGLDAAGRPLTPLRTYADTRAAPDAAALRARLDAAAIHERTGCMLQAGYWPAQLSAIRRTQPALWQAVARWATLGEYLEHQLFGQARVSFSAGAWTGLLERRKLNWDEQLLAELDLAAGQLAPLVDLDAPLTGLVEPYAQRWPTLRNLPWFPAIGDGAAASIGSGCTTPQRIALTVGTSGALRLVGSPPERVPPGLWCYRVDRHTALLGGATSEGGNLYAWLYRLLRLDEPATTEAALAAYPPDGHGLTVLPFVAGERSPGWAGNVPASFHGLTLATTPIAILRAGLEAVAYRFAMIERRLCEYSDVEHHLIASGQALLGSPAWMQIIADALGRSLVASDEVETTSRGVALLALRSSGLLTSLDDAPIHDGRIYRPDPARQAIYQAAMNRQAWLYERLISAGERG